jgi:hypothetical protein
MTGVGPPPGESAAGQTTLHKEIGTLSYTHFFTHYLLNDFRLCFQGISEEVFGTLATMLPSIFRVSNPLVFKASSSTPHTPKSG